MGTARGSDEGFTLLELMAVTAILGILVAIAVASYALTADTSRRVSCAAQQRVVSGAVIEYQNEHGNALPLDLGQVSPYVSGTTYDKCPDTGLEYAYDPSTGAVSCSRHPSP